MPRLGMRKVSTSVSESLSSRRSGVEGDNIDDVGVRPRRAHTAFSRVLPAFMHPSVAAATSATSVTNTPRNLTCTEQNAPLSPTVNVHGMLQVEIEELKRCRIVIPSEANCEFLSVPSLVNSADATSKPSMTPTRHQLIQGELVCFYVVIQRSMLEQRNWTGKRLLYDFDIQSDDGLSQRNDNDTQFVKDTWTPWTPSRTTDSSDRLPAPEERVLPNGDVCTKIQMLVSVSIKMLDRPLRLQVYIRAQESNEVQDLQTCFSSLQTNDVYESTLRAFIESTPTKALSTERVSSWTNVRVLQPLQCGWSTAILGQKVCWSIRVRNRLKEESITIHSLKLHDNVAPTPRISAKEPIPNPLEFFVDSSSLPTSVGSSESHSFVMIGNTGSGSGRDSDGGGSATVATSASVPSRVTLVLTFSLRSLHSPILYQTNLQLPVSPASPLEISLRSPISVRLHASFLVYVVVRNSSSQDCELDMLIEPQSHSDALLCLQKSAHIGLVTAGESSSLQLEFLSLREGVCEIGKLLVHDRRSGQQYVQDESMFVLVQQH